MTKSRTFIIKNLANGRCYTVTGNENTTIQMVWAAEKCWFMQKTTVEITAPDGRKEIFKNE